MTPTPDPDTMDIRDLAPRGKIVYLDSAQIRRATPWRTLVDDRAVTGLVLGGAAVLQLAARRRRRQER